MFTSRCERATKQRHYCSRPTVVIACPVVRLAEAPVSKARGPLQPRSVVRRRQTSSAMEGKESTMICWPCWQDLVGRSENSCAIELARHRNSQTRWQPGRHCWQPSFQPRSPNLQASSGVFIRRKWHACCHTSCIPCVSGSNAVDQSKLPYSRFGRVAASRLLLSPQRSLAKQRCATLFIFTRITSYTAGLSNDHHH
jgi:hypothetical protein